MRLRASHLQSRVHLDIMSTSQRNSLDVGAEAGSSNQSTLQDANGRSIESLSRPTSVMAPSVQFDEQNLLASPSAQREARGSRDLPVAPVSPRSSIYHGSSSNGSKVLANNKATASSSSLRHGQTLRNTSSRASIGGSSSGLTVGRSISSPRKSRTNTTVVTRPAWARDDSISPPHSPLGSPRSRSTRPSITDPDSLNLPASMTDTNQQTGAGAGVMDGNQALTGLTTTAETAEQAEREEAQSSNPDRWWTFTLPQKYRSRLHEHHLRMAFHHERSRTNTLDEEDEKKEPEKRRHRSRSNRKRRSSDSFDANPSSDGGSDTEMDDMRGRTSDRHVEHGLGAEHWNGVAAGLGASGLLHWKQSSDYQNANGKQNGKARNGDAKRLESPSPDGTSTTKADDGDLEKQRKPDYEQDKYPTMSFRARMEHPDVFTVHQPATPGWASPWKPEERGQGFDAGDHRFGPSGFFPRTESGRTYGSDGKQKKQPWLKKWRKFLIHNPFVPLLFRVINIAFTSATLAVAIELLLVLRNQGASDAVGSSPLVAIIFAPLSLAHVVFQIWLEYFGRPIGLWTVQSKLSYTVLELVFICLWSAELSLTFDNYFTSTLVCFPHNSPFIGPRTPPADRTSPLNDPSRKPYLCRLQGSLIGLVFVSLLAYIIVLTVSLFRIFVRVTGGGRR